MEPFDDVPPPPKPKPETAAQFGERMRADDVVGSTCLVVAPRGVILRSGPDLEADIVGEVAQGALVEAVACEMLGDRVRARVVGDGCDGWATLKPTLMARGPSPTRWPRRPGGAAAAAAARAGRGAGGGRKLYAVDGVAPTLPASGRCWIAPARVVAPSRRRRRENAVLHCDPGAPCAVGRGCTIGHRVTLHGCSVGDGTLVGMGAVVLNHAKIGRNCLVGAGSLVAERATFPDNSLVAGNPAKLVRALTDAQAAGLRAGAADYAALARKLRGGLVEVDAAACVPEARTCVL
ncbi:carbonate dehydratase [Aureococcus anophagefferens]|nr:carbonate dehydratase [Aureococcus anophagefferens]